MWSDRQQTQQEEEGGDEWLGTFSDMITLVLCFFIILTAIFAIKEGDVLEAAIDSLKGMGKKGTQNELIEKKREAIRGVAKSLDVLAKSSQYKENIKVKKQRNGIEIEINENEGKTLFLSGSASLTREAQEFIFEVARRILYPPPLKLFSIRLEDFQSDFDTNNISVELRDVFEKNGITLPQNIIVSPVIRDSNKDEFLWLIIDEDDRQVLYSVWKAQDELDIFDPYQLIDIISQTITEIEIQGHTDSLPINSRKFPSNWELSLVRANNVRRFLEKNLDFPDKLLRKVHVSGYANNEPSVFPEEVEDDPEQTRTNRDRNRRVVIFLATR